MKQKGRKSSRWRLWLLFLLQKRPKPFDIFADDSCVDDLRRAAVAWVDPDVSSALSAEDDNNTTCFLFFIFLQTPGAKMTQSEPQRQSEPRRLLHAVYIWHKYTEPL